MSLDPDTPLGQYAKWPYHVRIVARVPRHVERSTMRSGDFKAQGLPQPNFKMYGTTLCALDVIMAHGAAMYAAGRLMNTIRNPFNASVIRAEMDALRDRNYANVTPEDIKRWKEHVSKGENEEAVFETHNPKNMRSTIPPCPYLFQLAWKKLYVGNNPPYWCGAREFGLQTPNGLPPLHALGRAGTDTFDAERTSKGDPTFLLYIDVSNPLEPRYAFMLKEDIARVAANFGYWSESESSEAPDLDTNRSPHPIRIFNAQDMGMKYIIPESERHTNFEDFGEKREAHVLGNPGHGRRASLSRLVPEKQAVIKSNPEYIALCETRKARAQEHPAVSRMTGFGWFSKDDVLRSDGTALLQEVWQTTCWKTSSDTCLFTLIERPESVVVSEPQVSNGSDLRLAPAWNPNQFHIVSAPSATRLSLMVAATDVFLTQFTINSIDQGGILAQLASLDPAELMARRVALARRLWLESAKGGSNDLDETYEWLHFGIRPEEHDDVWRLDYADAESLPDPVGSRMLSVMLYQALCYRDTVARERKRRQSDNAMTVSDESLDSYPFSLLFKNEEIPRDYFYHSEYPGQSLGDIAHPALDVSHFPQIRDAEIICGLKLWSEHVWMPDLGQNDWCFESGTCVSIRTLNVSGCYYATRGTIKRALETVPSITRIIAIACPNFTEGDIDILSLDGTLNGVDCILTTSVCREPFRHYNDKVSRRDRKIEGTRRFLPAPPNDEVKKSLDAIPGVCFGTTPTFKFEYDPTLRRLYCPEGLHNRRPTHAFARPPALGFDSVTHKVVCGPPRFSVLLDSNWSGGTTLTGATLPRIPIDFGFDSAGANGSGLTAIWQGIVDLVEFLWFDKMRNVQRQDALSWSLLVKSCFSGSGAKWGTGGGLAGGGEFYGFPAYFKGGSGQANEEWAFVYSFRDTRSKLATAYTSNSADTLYPQSDLRDAWGFIRYGRDADVISQYVPTVVVYDVRGFRQAVCPNIPISSDEAKWIDRVEHLLTNGAWTQDHAVINVHIDRGMLENGDPMLGKLKRLMEKLSKPQFLKDNPREVVRLIDRIVKSNMNNGKDMF